MLENTREDEIFQEALRILNGKLPYKNINMWVYLRSNGEVFSELKGEFEQLWSECIVEATYNLREDGETRAIEEEN